MRTSRSGSWQSVGNSSRRLLKNTRNSLISPNGGQITERFTRAVDQLGGDSEDIRLGGVYALQQISRDASPESNAIYEILAAYVRIHAPWHRQHDRGPVHVEAIPRLRESAPAVQAAMLVLGRRKKEEPNLPLGLMGTDLRRLRLSDVDIPEGANLAHVLLWRASLIDASLNVPIFTRQSLAGLIYGIPD